MNDLVKINRLGHQGDGIAETANGPVYIPYTLPGETAETKGTGTKRDLVEIRDASDHRVEPFCRHFGKCGGCQLQHFEHEAYLAWKSGILAKTLAMAGMESDPEPVLHYPRASRRRAVFTAIRTQDGILLGFSERSSNRIVNLHECPVMMPQMQILLPAIRDLCHLFAPRKGIVKAAVVLCENGADLSVNNGQPVNDSQIRDAVSHQAMEKFLRLSINGEIVLEKEKPVLRCGQALVSPVPDGFVQAIAAAEEDMAHLVCSHLADCKKVADLFCGHGPFALRLAVRSEVMAAESHQAALDALDRAWRNTGGNLKRIALEKRDLFRRPLSFQEMKNMDGAVFDPPRAGAELQAQQLAKSSIGKLAAVSCNPKTLARDLNILIDGGFELQSITPIDQFACTPHLEAVALLER